MRRLVALALATLGVWGCASLGVPGTVAPLRLSELAAEGDPARRASQRLLLRALDDDARGAAGVAAQYERALQVDPTNPYVYLALARHQIEAGEPGRALAFLDKAEALIDQAAAFPGPDGTSALSLRVEPHRLGLRGSALQALGRSAEARPLLAEARHLAPGVWADGQLDAAELR